VVEINGVNRNIA